MGTELSAGFVSAGLVLLLVTLDPELSNSEVRDVAEVFLRGGLGGMERLPLRPLRGGRDGLPPFFSLGTKRA